MRRYTLPAKHDQTDPCRIENMSWRLWASPSRGSCAPHSPDLSLTAKELLDRVDMSMLTQASRPLFAQPIRGRQSEGLGQSRHVRIPTITLSKEGAALCLEAMSLFNDDPKVVLHDWRGSTKEATPVVLDGQSRSRRENQCWRLWGMSRRLSPTGRITAEVTPLVHNERLSLRTPSVASDRSWFRTPSPEYRQLPQMSSVILPSTNRGPVHASQANPGCFTIPAVTPSCPGMSLVQPYVVLAMPASFLPQMQILPSPVQACNH